MNMNIKGIDYDLGNYYGGGHPTRPTFARAAVKREIEIIKRDLHCNAIRLNGKDIERLTFAAECAIDQGLQVWFLPKYVDANVQDTLTYLAEAAQAAEKLRAKSQNVVFVVGCEFTMFLNGILEGANIIERMNNAANWERMRRGDHNEPLNNFLAKAVAEVRQRFHGALTYASIPAEKVDWSLFDFVGLDHYREVRNRSMYAETLERYFTFGKPVIITEFGCCAYKGADDKGARGWEVVDMTAPEPQLIDNVVRDEGTQARELMELLHIFDAAKVEGAFVYTFSTPSETYNDNPKFDLDMANYGLVKSYADGTWDEKKAFHAVAAYYTKG
jgi:hypothetical protein